MEKSCYPLTGMEEVYIATKVVDTSTGYSAGVPEYFAPPESGEWSEEQGSEDAYFGNQLQNVFYGSRKNTIKVVVSGVTAQKDAEIRGLSYDTSSGTVTSTGDEEPPDVALALKMNKGKDDYVCVWFPKCKCKSGTVKAQTKADKVTISTMEYEFSVIVTDYRFTVDGKTRGIAWIKGDTTSAGFDMTNWFSQVQTPLTVKTVITALELSSSVPLADATNAAVSVKPALTFSNAIASHGVFLINAATGATIATTIAFDSAGKIMTITPTASLTATTKYGIVVSGVKDVYGQMLANMVRYFTTV